MRKGKAAAAAGAVALAVLLSGCAMAGLDPQTLMRPPRSTGDRESIHQVLEEKTNNRLNLQYPRRGDYRSAILMHDLSADGSEEAVGLYQAKTENGRRPARSRIPLPRWTRSASGMSTATGGTTWWWAGETL